MKNDNTAPTSNERHDVDLAPRTKQFALQIIALYSVLSRDTVAQVLGKQILRSGTAVGANYREAYRGRSTAEFVAKMGDCLKELEETSYWLELMAEAGVAPPQNLAAAADETRQLTAIFVTIIKRTKERNHEK